MHIDHDVEKLELFVIRYDKNEKKKIKYSEFCTAFAPTSPRT